MTADRRSAPLPWSTLFSLMLAIFATAVAYGIVLPVLPFLIERVAAPAAPATLSWHTGLVSGLYMFALFLCAALWGKLSDRWGRRPVLMAGLAGLASTLALFATVENLPLVYVGRFLNGVFAAAVAPAAYALVGDHAPSKEWRAQRFTLLNVAGSAGFLIGPLLAGLALRAARSLVAGVPEYPVPLVAVAVFTLAVAVMVWLFLPRADFRPIDRSAPRAAKTDRGAALRLLTIAFVTAAAVGTFEVGLALRGKQILGMDAYQIGTMFTECSLVMLVVQAVVFSPVVKPEMTRWLVAPSLAILAAALVAMPFAGSYLTMVLAVAPIAASAGIIAPIVTFWISLGAGDRQGAELGQQTAAASLGQALGSAIGGLLFNITILPEAAFMVAAATVLAGLAASIGLPRRLVQLPVALASRSRGSSSTARRYG